MLNLPVSMIPIRALPDHATSVYTSDLLSYICRDWAGIVHIAKFCLIYTISMKCVILILSSQMNSRFSIVMHNLRVEKP